MQNGFVISGIAQDPLDRPDDGTIFLLYLAAENGYTLELNDDGRPCLTHPTGTAVPHPSLVATMRKEKRKIATILAAMPGGQYPFILPEEPEGDDPWASRN